MKINAILLKALFVLMTSQSFTLFCQSTSCIFSVKNVKAFFHNKTITNGISSFTPRKGYLVQGDRITISCKEKSAAWVYASYTNSNGAISNGYLKRSDLEEVNVVMKSKRQLLESLSGERKLKSISGSSGANGLFDYEIKNNKWVARGSALENGMRQAYPISISSDELSLLNSMKITVKQDLSITFTAGGKSYISIPFIENGLYYKIKSRDEGSDWPVPSQLRPSTTFLDGTLYLYAVDGVTEDNLDFAVNYFGGEESTLLLSYDPMNNLFSLTVSGFNSVTYYF